MSNRSTSTETTQPPMPNRQEHYITHKIRMEIMLEGEDPKFNVARTVHKLFLKAQTDAPVHFADTYTKEITDDNFPAGKEFIDRFLVNQVPCGKKKKVLVGFFMRSTSGLAAIKRSVGYQ